MKSIEMQFRAVSSLLLSAVHYLYVSGEWEIIVTAIAQGTARLMPPFVLTFTTFLDLNFDMQFL